MTIKRIGLVSLLCLFFACSIPIWGTDNKPEIGAKFNTKSRESQFKPQINWQAPYKTISFANLKIKQVLAANVINQNRAFILTEQAELLLCQIPGNQCRLLSRQIESFNWHGKKLLAIAIGKQAFVYNTDSNNPLFLLLPLREAISSLSFSTQGDSLLIGTLSGRIYHWYFNKSANSKDVFSNLNRYAGHATVIKKILPHQDDRVFFSTDWQGKLSAWLSYEAVPYQYNKELSPFNGGFWTEIANRVATQLAGKVEEMILRNDGKYLLFSFDNGSIQLWAVRGFVPVCKIELQSKAFKQLQADSNWSKVTALNSFGKSFQLDFSRERFKTENFGELPECDIKISKTDFNDQIFKKIFFSGSSLFGINADGIQRVQYENN